MIEKGLLTHLTTSITATASSIYAQVLPQDADFPAITYFKVSAPRHYYHEGQIYAEPRMQIDCWAYGYLEAKNLAEQVRVALSGYTGTYDSKQVMSCFLVNETDIYDMDTKLYRVIMDFRFTIKE